jgi:cardiolipin synthase
MRKFLSRLFSKLVICALIILLQFGWIVYATYRATTQSSVLNILLHLLAVTIALYVVNKDMKPYFKLSWIFLILFLPIFGCPAYFLFGRSDLTKHSAARLRKVAEPLELLRPDHGELLAEVEGQDENAAREMRYIAKTAYFPPYREADSRYYPSGEAAFPQILKDIENAKEFIFLEFFIIQPGKMFDAIVDRLEQKAKEGVHVRLIYDGVGSISTLPPKYYKTLQAKGIHCACFNPFRPFLSIIMNNRDHRKILVVDGKIAYTGGINLADEYINEIKKYGYWKDAAVRITGEAVWSFTTMFLEMWNYIVRGTEDYTRFRAEQPESSENGSSMQSVPSEHGGSLQSNLPGSRGYVQPYADSPLFPEHIGENVYLNMINMAHRYVYIYTPYLIIDSEMSTALCNAAKSGVDVRIITPGIPDKKTVFLLTRSHYPELLKNGVKIYQYTPGFVHAKCFVCDDKYATVGSINLDYRSLCLHFECGALFYQSRVVAEVQEDILQTLSACEEITIEQCENLRLPTRLVRGVLRLFAPLL